MGIAFYNHRSFKIKQQIRSELRKFDILRNQNNSFLDKQFTYIWFMITLFHDLGYKFEKEGTKLDITLNTDFMGVPNFYADIYLNYYRYREEKDHGISAGIVFDRDICDIRRFQEHNDKSELLWDLGLEEVYRYVAWIIVSHNIWYCRKGDKEVKDYEDESLKELILEDDYVQEDKDENIKYSEYKILFDAYPLFFLFCLIDTIEPMKSSNSFTNIDIEFKKKLLIINSNDNDYLKKISSLNNWLVHVKKSGNRLEIVI